MRTLSRVTTANALSDSLKFRDQPVRSRRASQGDPGMADRFLQHTVEAIARKMLDEAGPQQRMDLRELIGVHDPVTPRPVHIHEVDAFARISRRRFGPGSARPILPTRSPAMIRELRPGRGFLISRSANALVTNTPMPHATILCPAIGRSDSITFA